MITAVVFDSTTGKIRMRISAELDYILANVKDDESYTVLYDDDDLVTKPDMQLLNADVGSLEVVNGEVYNVIR